MFVSLSHRSVLWLLAVPVMAILLLFALPGQMHGVSVVADEPEIAEEAPPIYKGASRIDAPKEDPKECKECEEAQVVNPAAELAKGGPDEFGYNFADSNESGGPIFNFIDISSSGQELYLYDDDVVGPFSIGFDFEFYGETRTDFYIGSNGLIGFAPEWLWSLSNRCPVVAPETPNDVIAILWDDLVPGYGGIFFESFDRCPYGGSNACLVVQYTDIYHFFGGSAGEFEAILFDDGTVLLQFDDAGSELGSYSSTGIENATGTDGLTYACDQPASLSSGLAVRFNNRALTLSKTASESLPLAGQPLTYSIMVENTLDTDVEDIALADLLPPDVDFLGPVTLTPDHPEATVAQSGDDLPGLIDGLTVAAGTGVTITLPATLSAEIDGTRINRISASSPNLPDVTSAEAEFYALPDCETIGDNPVENCSFETGDFTSWITSEISLPFLALQVAEAGVDTRYGQFVSEPIRGDFAAVSGFDGSGPGVIEIAQDVALPADATSLEFTYRVGYDLATYNAFEPRQFEVEVQPEGGGVYPLQNTVVYVAGAGRNLPDSDDLLGQVDVSNFAGTSVRIIFRLTVPEEDSGPAMFQLDNIIANQASPPYFTNSASSHAETGVEYLHRVIASDKDVGEALTLTLAVADESNRDATDWLSFEDHGNGTGTLSGTPGRVDIGEHAVTVIVTDERGHSSQQEITIEAVAGIDPYQYFVPIYALPLDD